MPDYPVGQTALLATVAETEPVVGPWRLRFDAAAAAGVPAHVTVLYPFLDADRISPAVLDDLGTVIGAHRSFAARFGECRRFPDVLYLAPTPDEPFRALTESTVRRWPEAPPYEGQFAEVIPHLTVAHRQPPAVLDELEATLAGELPIPATISSVTLFVSDGKRWSRRADFPLSH